MIDLKKIEQKDIPYALERADRYRQMNEPLAAESICLDVLNVEPNHQDALVNLLLSLSEQFKDQIFPAYDRALEVLARMDSEYQKIYYKGIIFERRAKAHMNRRFRYAPKAIRIPFYVGTPVPGLSWMTKK